MNKTVPIILRYHFPDMEMRSPEQKPRRGVGRRGVPGHSGGQQRGPLAGKEDENQAWLAMLEKATNSVRYISRHIKKEHFIREVREWADMREGVGWKCLHACVLHSLTYCYSFSCLLKFHPQLCLICFVTADQNDIKLFLCPEWGTCEAVLKADTDSHLWTFLFSFSLFLCLSVPLSLSHSGCSRLEVRGSGVGQDFPVGLPHSVNTGNCSNLHPCSADVPQHTLMNSHTNSRILPNSSFLFSSLSLPMIYW